jgi:uncharacterized protein (DUF1499 family)
MRLPASFKWIVLVVALGTAAWAFTTWPRINDVETGRTPEYPDLQPRRYSAGVEQVVQAAREAVTTLPRWELVGAGHGPAGAELHAVRTTRVWRFKDDVTVKVRREGGRTLVSVRSRSRVGQADFGQNARNIRELLAALDARLDQGAGRRP